MNSHNRKQKAGRQISKANALKGYAEFLRSLKTRIRETQVKAALSANRELILLYWEIGHRLGIEQKRRGWGAAVIPRLARDLRNELPEVKGFSERNIGYMLAFAREYGPPPILQQPVAKLPAEVPPEPPAQTPDERVLLESILPSLPWGHNIVLLEKVKDRSAASWSSTSRQDRSKPTTPAK